MMKRTPARGRPQASEEGYVLVAVIFMLALLMIALLVAAPNIKKEIQRDRDVETMHRGKQYIRAIKLYYKKFGSYPPNVEALVKTNNIRFLRKRYIDPITGKDDWKPIHFGQNKAPTALGFFGQPIMGSTMAGMGPGGGNGLNCPPSNSGSSAFGSSGSTFGSPGGSSGCPTGSSDTTGGSDTTSGSTDTSGSTNPAAESGASGSGTGTGLTGQTFGGGGIIGFSPNSPKQSILIYKKKDHYNQWEFVYDPIADQMMMQGGNAGGIGQPAGSTTTPVGGGSSFGSSPGAGGSSGGINSGGSSPTPPSSPPQ